VPGGGYAEDGDVGLIIGSGYGYGSLDPGVLVGEFSVITTGAVAVGPLHAAKKIEKMNIDTRILRIQFPP
jgi:hypothetical protein